jgi:hypothetical protein
VPAGAAVLPFSSTFTVQLSPNNDQAIFAMSLDLLVGYTGR